MSILQMFAKELEAEAKTTRKMLDCVPDGKNDWKPHTKSMELMRLAVHVAEIPSWFDMIVNKDEFDYGTTPYKPEPIENKAELVAYFDKVYNQGRDVLLKADDNVLPQNWKLRAGDQVYMDKPKGEVLRECISHIVHHRAQLGVYLRLLDIPIPGSYGPSADEHPM